ncbi:type IV secretion system DNA-binding domain-containing protein [uncultured Desulfobacter sp.]|uniref:ATP-binding protein n=1 Tax=uncultured Desulfobacter sp. TaxID=240139 RepID=UPI002AABF1CE|nr:type IV secretion system DNA-binding domain-containing protein [uncultured Desulfobacter sp.]
MKHFSLSVCNYIKAQVERYKLKKDSGAALIMLPSFPAGVMIHIGRELEAGVVPLVDTLVYKIAKPLWKEWERTGDLHVLDFLKQASQKKWLDESGNLTCYRNLGTGDEGKTAAVILGGMDHVTDAGSLADFHRCSIQTIWGWSQGMSANFQSWTRALLNDHTIAYESETIVRFDEVLNALLTRVPTDIIRISEFMDQLDLSGAQDGRDAEQALLRSLGFFNLPDLTAFKFGGKQTFAPYVETALSFFSYAMFLEKRPRDNAVKAVRGYQKKHAKENTLSGNNQIGSFQSDDEFLNALAEYIDEGTDNKLNALLQCDFVVIRDKILKYKEKKNTGTQPPPSIKKLGTDPLESVLTGLWLTLGFFRKKLESDGMIVSDVLEKISIRSFLFKHDRDGDSADEKNKVAMGYLEKVVGGLDHWLSTYIQIDAGPGQEFIKIESQLIHEEIDLQYSSVAEPVLGFKVVVEATEETNSVSQRFYIRLPATSPFRTAAALFESVSPNFEKKYILPAFSIPYFEELMLAKDEDEANRVLMYGVRGDKRVADLLPPILRDLDQDEKEFGERLKALSHNYGKFIRLAAENSIYQALSQGWDDLRRALSEVFNTYLEENSPVQRDKGSILARGFLIVGEDAPVDDEKWIWQAYEPAAAITVLHPALLELIHARILYLFDCFNAEVGRQLSSPKSKSFQLSAWDYYLDLSAIKMPLCGLLKNNDLVFETDIRGTNLLHRIGGGRESQATLSTRLLLKYDAFEDEDISDSEMFHQSRESLMLFRIIRDYWKLHPHAKDGISLAVYQNQDIQPVIAAIDQFISAPDRLENDTGSTFHVSLTLFSESSDDTGVNRWIEQWKERWEAAENHSKFAHYRACRLSVAHRIVTSYDNYAQFIHIINASLEADIAVLSHFISAGVKGNKMEQVPAPHDVTSRPIQFPILEKACCSPSERQHQDERYRVLSNRQFMVATKHLEVLARLQEKAGHHIALGRGDFSPWRGVVDALHKNVEWVVCIDSNIDEYLLKKTNGSNVRDLIGFGSGVGSHGEANYTISTEQFHFSDLYHKLGAAISNVVEGWSNEEKTKAAKFAIEQAKGLSGLSLIRATGVSQHIREVLAYALARKKFHINKEALCDQFISLDAYQHWLDNASSNMRPDILHLTASVLKSGMLHLDLRVIECKLGKQADFHIEKARDQVDCGLRHLIPSFMPRQENDLTQRPDARYWWLQLHRLIASRSKVNNKNRGDVLSALERLAEGEFSVSWGGALFTCWTNVETDNRQRVSWIFSFREYHLDILHVSLGSQEMKALCSEEGGTFFDWGKNLIDFVYQLNPHQNHCSVEDDPEDCGGRNDYAGSSSARFTKASSMETKESTPPAGETPFPELPAQAHSKSKSAKVTERIFLGQSVNGARSIFWEFGHSGLNNRHILIFGSSGMGKTYAIQCLLNELGVSGQNSIVVDYTNGFLPGQLEDATEKYLAPKQHIIKAGPFPISPFKLHEQIIGTIVLKDDYVTVAKRVAAIFKTVYDLGDQQFSVLFDAIISGMESYGEAMTLDGLLETLQDFLEDKTHSNSTVQSTLSKLKPFVMSNPFASNAQGMGWDYFFEDEENRCHVFQLAGLDMSSWKLVTEFLLWDLYAFVRAKGNKDMPKLVILDEVQNLDHREESPLAKYLTEGRKFGLAMVLATQTLSNLATDQQARLFQAGHKLFFKPAETEMKEYARVLENATSEPAKTWVERLSKLNKGECYSLGPSLEDDGTLKPKMAVKIKITAMEERNLNG